MGTSGISMNHNTWDRLSSYLAVWDQKTWDRLFGYRHAFDEPAVVVIILVLGIALTLTPLAILLFDRTGGLAPDLKDDLWRHYVSWLVMVPLVVVPVLLGAAWSMLFFTVLGLLSFREFARATGAFREKLMTVLVVIGILSLTFAVADHFYRLFVALTPMNSVVITAVATSQDRPNGYIQRVALTIFGFMLFGSCLGHLDQAGCRHQGNGGSRSGARRRARPCQHPSAPAPAMFHFITAVRDDRQPYQPPGCACDGRCAAVPAVRLRVSRGGG